jgi:hypothetical protein
MVSVYPLPEGTPDYATAASMVSAQNDILSYVIQSMAGYVDESICTQQQLVDSVARTLMASACGRVSANTRRIAPVADSLMTSAAATCSEQQLALQRAIDPLQRTADPAVAYDPTILPGTAPATAAMPPGCTPVVYIDQPQNLLYPSGMSDDTYTDRSLAHAYYSQPGGLNTYYVVPSAQGPFLAPGNVLVGYFDCPAGWRPVGAGASSSVLWLCPVSLPVPTPGGDGATPPPPDQTSPLWYCGQLETGFWETFQLRGPITPELYEKYRNIRGPYWTQANAQASCGPNPTPPPLGDPLAGKWWCVHATDSLGLDIYHVAAFDSIEAVVAAAWEPFAGPFETKDAAQIACASRVPSPPPPAKCVTFSFPSLPRWCSTNVCDTIDAITAAVTGAGRIDLFKLVDAGTADNIGPDGTWLGKMRKIPLAGEPLYSFVVLVLCAVGEFANAVLTSTDSQAPAALVANGAVLLTGLLEKYLGTGFTDINRKANYWADYQSPTIIPSVGEADAAYVRGFIDQKQWRCWVRANNVCDEPHAKILETQWLRPSFSDAERLFRIGDINDEERRKLYRYAGIRDDSTLAMFERLYENWPGFNDIIAFMVRDVFDPDAIAVGKLDAEFDDKYRDQARYLGEIAGLDPEIAKLYWMAHWRQPSTQELYTMLHRLRPGAVPPDLVVDRTAVARQLGINDVAPAWREKLMEISYHSVSIRQARQFYQNDVIDQEGVEGIYLNQGYIPAQAKLAAENERIVKRRALAQLFKGWTPAAIANAYASGQMTIQEAHEHLEYLGASKEQFDQLTRRATIERNAKLQLRAQSKAITSSWQVILKAYFTGSVSREQAESFLLQHGWSVSSAQLALNAEDVRARQKVVDKAIATIRGSYLRAEIGLAAATSQLAAIGVAPARVQEYATTWQLELTGKRRVLAGQQVLRLFSEGLISQLTAETRLNLLGWRNPDLSLLITEARNKRLAAEVRVAKAAEQAKAAAAAALAREVKAQQALVKQTQAKLCSMVPISRLIKWFSLRYIELPYFQERLNICGYTPDVQENYIEEAIKAREAQDAKRSKASEQSTSSNGSATTG